MRDAPRVELGGWIRPVSSHGDGELFEAEIRLDDRKQPAILDVIDIPLAAPARVAHQPDNWQIERRGQWCRVGRMSRSFLSRLEEHPPHLWRNSDRCGRVGVASVASRPPQQSLYLIRPRNLRLRFWSETIPEGEHDAYRRRRRAVFEYGGIEYDLSLTDSRLTQQFDEKIPGSEEPRLEITPNCGDDCLLCLSLTTAYRGQHYKVVATVIPL